MNSLADRLKLALAESGKRKTDLWKACGITSGAVTQWFDGTTIQLEGKNLMAAAEVLGVNPKWLATGKGTKDSHLSQATTTMHETAKRLYEAAAVLGIVGQSNVAQALGESPQTLNNWEIRGISQAGLIKAQVKFQCSANWLATGTGTKESYTVFVRDPVLDDLDALLPEDADVWRAKIRAAATKARREKER